MKRIYIAGKIGNLPLEEVDIKFKSAKIKLEKLGWLSVVNPRELDHTNNKDWGDFMLTDLAALKECDSIFMLRDWMDSPGARIEHAFAHAQKIRIIYQ